ncbi:MAG TPA: hypothetical protein PLO78_05435 [Candidatus Omnitrophota bacterium]|nr:hypothetical protein [Candidatus Omnitrophota bacterium]
MNSKVIEKIIGVFISLTLLLHPVTGWADPPDGSSATIPKEISLPSPTKSSTAALFPDKKQDPLFYKPGGLLVRGPLPPTMIRGPQEVPVVEQLYRTAAPDFYAQSMTQSLPVPDLLFLEEKLIPTESVYFQPGIGMDSKSGMPYDHIRIRLKENLLSEVGNYTAASKLSLSIPFLLKVIQKNPYVRQVKLSPKEAENHLKRALRTILTFIQSYPDYEGFLPWVDIRPNGTIAPAFTKVPSLDNGQLTWALAAVVAAFEDANDPELRKLANIAQTILTHQNYQKFYDSKSKLMHGTIQYDPQTREWTGDKTYYLNDMFEGTLAVLWGVLNGQIPEEAWYNLSIPTIEYITTENEKITTLSGFRASFHEHWALGFLPIMESALAPLYQNYLYAQADHARRNQMPGFISTAYDPKGIYRQMGIPSIAYNPVDRSDVSVLYATAMAMLISPGVGAAWLVKLYSFKNFISPYGAYESVGRDGYSDIFTADAKGMTLLAATGGVVDEIKKYLRGRTVPRTGIPMDVKLIELLHAKYKQMLLARDNRPVFFPSKPFPPPTEKPFTAKFEKPKDPGPFFDVIAHLQPGHLHGKNVRSVDQKTLEQDVFPGQPFQFEFEIPAYYVYFDQWAFRGTYVDEAVSIENMRYVSLTIPVQNTPNMYELELKSDDITLATVIVNTVKPGVMSKDGKWKTIVERIKPIPESDVKPFNYVSVAIHDPRYLLGSFSRGGREGTIILKEIKLHTKFPFPDLPEPSYLEKPQGNDELELIRYWRLSHGDLPFEKDAQRGIYRFTGGAGWRGGYIPYTNLSKFSFLYIKLRNAIGTSCNCFYVELKHESDQLLGDKIPIHIPADSNWHVYQIPIPPHIKYTFNYIALSDPYAALDVGSMLLTSEAITGMNGLKIEKIVFPLQTRTPLECTYRPCPATLTHHE